MQEWHHTSFFQTSFDREKNTLSLLEFDIFIWTLLMMVWTVIDCTTQAPVVSVIGNLKNQRYIFQNLRPLIESYLRELGDVMFHQDNGDRMLAVGF
ncbi:hypothetical protein TNCV_62191 [Trichonephila clavipes]|nr:hypothetical protein TNCV_62191 [Trichonephila clavipes]